MNCTSKASRICKIARLSFRANRKDDFPEHFVCYVVVFMIVVTGFVQTGRNWHSWEINGQVWRSSGGGSGLTCHSQDPWRNFSRCVLVWCHFGAGCQVQEWWNDQSRNVAGEWGAQRQTKQESKYAWPFPFRCWWDYNDDDTDEDAKEKAKSTTVHRAAYQHIVYWLVASPERI